MATKRHGMETMHESMSGIHLPEGAKATFDAMSHGKGGQFVTWRIEDETIVVDAEGERGASWDDFVGQLPTDGCRYGVFDISFEDDGAHKSKLLFVHWSPDAAPVRCRTLSGATKENVKKDLGIETQGELQANDADDISYDSAVAAAKRLHMSYK